MQGQKKPSGSACVLRTTEAARGHSWGRLTIDEHGFLGDARQAFLGA